MTSKLVAASLLALSLAHSVYAKEKIVGGVPVTDLAEVPFMVSLSGSCGGSIISSKWILTAAHCVGFYSNVKGGVLNLKETGHNFRIKRSIKHPGYSSRTLTNDFALVELQDEIDFEATNLRAVEIASEDFESEGQQAPGIDATVFGFGDIKENTSNRDKGLNKVTVPIVSHEEANLPQAYNGRVDSTMLPAGYQNGGKDACQGDSGGPMVVYNHQNDPVQVGVVSWGTGCAREDKYGIYSKVSSAYRWIQNTISTSK